MNSDSQSETSARDDVRSARELSQQYGLDFLDSVSDEMLDTALLSDVPVEWARANSLLPVRLAGEPCVLTADPSRVGPQENLELLVGAQLRPLVAPRAVILDAIERCYYRRDDSPSEFLQGMGLQGQAEAGQRRGDDLLEVARQAPVTQFVNLVLLEAVKRHASDIHFEPCEARLRVRYRVDGVLYEQTSPPKNLEDALVSRLKVMAHLDIAEKRLPQDGMARVRVGEREIDIRMSTVPVADGERVVLRLLNRETALLPLDVLGMSAGLLESFNGLLAEANGIVVVCGPTGSGKTTTLYAALGTLDASRLNVLTIEEPIEYRLANIGQIQVRPKIGLTFASGLRHILRQDPDIILVGETRDLETARIAVRASLTGHLVFTTLHTNDAPGAILRLIDMGIEPYLLASCLRGVLAQRLVRLLCKRCRRPAATRAEDLAGLVSEPGAAGFGQLWEPAGCDSCLEGYSGRKGLFELMLVDSEVAGLIRSGTVSSERLREVAQQHGMTGLRADGLRNLREGLTSLAEVLNAVG